jgi:hypothetical protein
MELRRLLPHLLLFTYLLATFWLLGRAKNERIPDIAPGTNVLGFTKSFLAWWYTSMLFTALVISLSIYFGKLEGLDRVYFGLAVVVFALGGCIGTWYLHRYRLEYDNVQFTIRLPTGGHRTVAWESVVNVEHKKRSGVRVSVRSGKPAVVSQHLPGIDEFLNFASNKARLGA